MDKEMKFDKSNFYLNAIKISQQNMESFCAINVFKSEDVCINTDGIPLMYICDDTDGLIELLRGDLTFLNWLDLNNVTEPATYTTSYISAFVYNRNENMAENYKPYTKIAIQDIYAINEIRGLSEYIIKVCFNYLHDVTFGVPATFTENVKEDCIGVYKKIKEKYGTKVSKLTIINSIRSHLQTGKIWEGLIPSNIEILVAQIESLLNDEK